VLVRLPIDRKELGNLRKPEILKTCQNLTFERKKNKQKRAFENLLKPMIFSRSDLGESRERTKKEQRKNKQKQAFFRQLSAADISPNFGLEKT
jgi:hypothetical protein